MGSICIGIGVGGGGDNGGALGGGESKTRRRALSYKPKRPLDNVFF